MTRRVFIGSAAATALAPVAMGQAGGAVFAYVGCFTEVQRKGRGDGIHVYRVEPRTGNWTQTQVLRGLVNPSFLVTSADSKTLYSSHGDEAYATAYTIDPASGEIRVLNQGATGGKNGAHLALSPNGKFLIVANYISGTVAVLPVKADGGLADFIQLVRLEGTPGPHRTEQPGPHPHQIVFAPGGKFVLIPDKGLDQVFVFRFDPATGQLTPAEPGSVQSRSAAGPRHLAFHPTLPVVWVLNEMGNTVTTYRWDATLGVLSPLRTIPTLPEDFNGNSTAAELAVGPGAKFLYTSNRGHDSIGTFAIDPKTGFLRSVRWTAAGGKVPRYISVDPSGRYLFSTNEQSDTITKFRIQGDNGMLHPEGTPIPNGSAVTIAFRA